MNSTRYSQFTVVRNFVPSDSLILFSSNILVYFIFFLFIVSIIIFMTDPRVVRTLSLVWAL